MKSKQSILHVHSFPGHKSLGVLRYNGINYNCALGKGGIGLKKSEGDNITPQGTYSIKRLYIRKDRCPYLKSRLPIHYIRPQDRWCDNPESRHYNKLIRHDEAHLITTEHLWRNDHLYDMILEITYNEHPIVKNKGSAIFIHVSNSKMKPTAGCIALKNKDLSNIIKKLDKFSIIKII